MAILTVGPNSNFPTIAAAMSAANANDTIQLETSYSNETVTVIHNGMTVTGDTTSTGIILQLATGIAAFNLGGTAPIKVLDAPDGNDLIGNDGDNVIRVMAGADAVSGGLGTDRLVVDYSGATGAVTGDSTSNFAEAGGGGRLVTINGGFEHFTIVTGSGDDTITTGAGDDVIRTGNGAGTVTAGQGANVIIGGNGADTFTALDGGNRIYGGDGANTLTSGGGNDVILSGVDSDTIVAGGGSDRITIVGGADSSDAGAGVDRLIVDYAALVTAVTGGVSAGTPSSGYSGNIADLAGNTVDFQNTEHFTISTGAGDDKISTGGGSDILTGGSGNDVFASAGGEDVLKGGDGSDWLSGGSGQDVLLGGEGDDTYTVDAAGEAIEAHNQGMDTVRSLVTNTLGRNLESLVLIGGGTLDGTGNVLDNRITGNSASNSLNGLFGDDRLTGGAGADQFLFTTALNASANVDRITDFQVGVDEIHLDNAIFAGLADGALAFGAFRSGAAAADPDDRIIYDAANGALFFDSDGVGGAAQVRFAILDPGLALAAGDFFVL